MEELPQTLVMMGVSGAGKTEVGREVAQRLEAVFDDADDFHTDEAREKMRSGQGLTDEDRWPWLERLRSRIEAVRAAGRRHVLACSALKAVYRDVLRGGDGEEHLVFVLLEGSRELISQRMGARQGHYMPLSLLDSQLALLEETPDLVRVTIEGSVPEIADSILMHWTAGQGEWR